MSGGDLEGRVGYQMKRAQHALRLEMDGALRSLGITTPQYAALSVLEEEPGVSGARLARRCFVTPQTMNLILVKLENARLIERRPHQEHGRVLRTNPTKRGAELASRAHELVEDIEEIMLAGLDEGERLELAEALRGCADALARPPGEATRVR